MQHHTVIFRAEHRCYLIGRGWSSSACFYFGKTPPNGSAAQAPLPTSSLPKGWGWVWSGPTCNIESTVVGDLFIGVGC